jgi:hypothetical protein
MPSNTINETLGKIKFSAHGAIVAAKHFDQYPEVRLAELMTLSNQIAAAVLTLREELSHE